MEQCNDDPDVVGTRAMPRVIEPPATGMETVRIPSNRPPVHPECVGMSTGKTLQVYMESTSAIYDVTLNQTFLENNNNKYYKIQLLEEASLNWYHVWIGWGRVGDSTWGCKLYDCGTELKEAKSMFENKFLDKTENEWMNQDSFVKVAGKYDQLKLDHDNRDAVASKLDPKVQNLVSLIYNLKAMEDLVIEMKYDTQKAPLGKLTVDQIKDGYLALKQIERCIEDNMIDDELNKACDAFYTRIPHNFGRERPPVIRTKQEFKAKLALLEALSDIQVALTVLKSERNEEEHPIDQKYHALKCQIKPIDNKSKLFKLIQSYVLNTHGETHNQYTMTVDEVFDLDKEGEKLRFKDVGNRMLLWHGSRMTNWAGILGQGLRIAPPEAPKTAYMFGKGVYFADMSSKSANYCHATSTDPIGLLTLCEVALGNENQLLAADENADALPAGKQSVKGLGSIAPDPEKNFTMGDGTIVPLGEGMNTGVNNPDPNGYTLNYNEYIVYNTNQIRMRYLVKLKFNFK